MKDLTQGNTTTALWHFTTPLVLSMVFQQLYNMADSVIVGRFVGNNALAAVATSYPVLMIFLSIATGFQIGSSVVISQYFGAGHIRRVKTAASTAVISMVVVSLVLSVVGYLLSHQTMVWLQTPAEIMEEGLLYLQVTIYGLLFLFLYQIANGIFTALGDSKTPLYFLIGSSVSNIFLDIYFVKGLAMGVAGAAWATFICQGVAAMLAVWTLARRLRRLGAGKGEWFSSATLWRIGTVAVPSILQQSFISVGNLLIQGLVNSFGAVVMAAYGAAVKLNTFSIMTLTTVANGMSAFAAQNKGAGNIERIKEGTRSALMMASIVSLVFFLLLGVGAPYAVGSFLPKGDKDPAVVAEGVRFLRVITPFYFVVMFKLIPDGVMRGAGAMRLFMISTLSDLILRVILSFILARSFHLGPLGIWLSWPIGWTVGMVVSVYFYKSDRWTDTDLLQEKGDV